MVNVIKAVVLIVVVLFFITFGVENSTHVTLQYYFFLKGMTLPLYGLVYLSVLIGIFIGMIVGVFERHDMKKSIRRLKMETKELIESVADGKIEKNEE